MRWLVVPLLGAALPLVAGTAYFAAVAWSREPPAVAAASVHPSLSRESCIDCHAPIADEWRESFHFQSLSGPFWARIRARAFDHLFEALRVPCSNCHAPANVLDLPEGAHPAERTDARELGVDCVSCHVSGQGILGSGRRAEAPHEVIADERFRDPVRAAEALCAHCHEEDADHARTVTAWRQSRFAAEGTTCLHCHMPEVVAPAVAGGEARPRRSHRFPGDKDPEMLRRALHAELELSGGRQAIVRIHNDRTGHSLPASGMNALIAEIRVLDARGDVVEQVERSFGVRELIPGYLDFWPFLKATQIPAGESREIAVPLPPGPGRVTVRFRYRDWFTVTDRDAVVAELERAYAAHLEKP